MKDIPLPVDDLLVFIRHGDESVWKSLITAGDAAERAMPEFDKLLVGMRKEQ